jgi:hypothetical protein
MDLKLTGIFCWRRVVELGFVPLESFLSVEQMLDKALICVDPDGAETMKLVNALASKFPHKIDVVEFEWPIGATGDGSVIGIASNYALQQVRTSHFCNIQADELWNPVLMTWMKGNWRSAVAIGYDCMEFKVLHLQHNMQEFQGGGAWERQDGAGYVNAIKFGKVCPDIIFSHDAWSLEGCALKGFVDLSNNSPIVHAHDNFRDHLIALRRNASDALWTDQEKFGHYKASADTIEVTKDDWWNSPKWTATTSPFKGLLPEYAKRLLGRTSYSVDYDLLRSWPT